MAIFFFFAELVAEAQNALGEALGCYSFLVNGITDEISYGFNIAVLISIVRCCY